VKLPAGWQPKNQDLSIELPNWNWRYLGRCLAGSIMYWLMMGVIVYCASYFTDYDTKSQAYESFYNRVMVNTTYFPVG